MLSPPPPPLGHLLSFRLISARALYPTSFGASIRFVGAPIRLLVVFSLLVSALGVFAHVCPLVILVSVSLPVEEDRDKEESQMAAGFFLGSSRISRMLDYPWPKSQCDS